MPYAPIKFPEDASFKDMVALKGKPDIGDQINKKIIGPLAKSDFPDFNDAAKLGSGKEMVERLTNLVAIFENLAPDFSRNRAEGDDILGGAYEYLMRHFATESGTAKGQFYTPPPPEVSRVIAQILGIRSAKTSNDTTVYDPTCGPGSLLLKVADEARTKGTLYGQEKDAATSGLGQALPARIFHPRPGTENPAVRYIEPANPCDRMQLSGGASHPPHDLCQAGNLRRTGIRDPESPDSSFCESPF